MNKLTQINKRKQTKGNKQKETTTDRPGQVQ